MQRPPKNKKLRTNKRNRLEIKRGRILDSFEPSSKSLERRNHSLSKEKIQQDGGREYFPLTSRQIPKNMLLGNLTLRSTKFSTPEKLPDKPRFDIWSRTSSTSQKLRRLNRSPAFLNSRRESLTSSKNRDGYQSPNFGLSSRNCSISQEPKRSNLTHRARPVTTAETRNKVSLNNSLIQDSAVHNKERTPSPTITIPLKPSRTGRLPPPRPKSSAQKKVTLQTNDVSPTQKTHLTSFPTPRVHQDTQNSSSFSNLHAINQSMTLVPSSNSKETSGILPKKEVPKSAGFKYKRRIPVFNGIWDQYEDIWFDIHCNSMIPLFEEFPMPEIKASIIRTLPKQEKQSLPQPNKPKQKNQLFRIRTWKPEDDLIDEKCACCVHRWGKVCFECGHLFLQRVYPNSPK